MNATDINEGRGFPLAEEPAPVTIAPHRELLFELIASALREEGSLIARRERSKRTDFPAGRVSGFVSSAARLMAVLYDGDYQEGKKAIMDGVREAGKGFPVDTFLDRELVRAMAVTIAEAALRVI